MLVAKPVNVCGRESPLTATVEFGIEKLGGSFTGLTVIETVAAALVSGPEQTPTSPHPSGSPRSVTVKAKLSGPLKSGSGV